MTKKEILTSAIKAWREPIEVIENNPGWDVSSAYGYCRRSEVHFGLCNYADTECETYIYGMDWVENVKRDYWCTTVNLCHTIPEILTSLRTRLEIMEREILINE